MLHTSENYGIKKRFMTPPPQQQQHHYHFQDQDSQQPQQQLHLKSQVFQTTPRSRNQNRSPFNSRTSSISTKKSVIDGFYNSTCPNYVFDREKTKLEYVIEMLRTMYECSDEELFGSLRLFWANKLKIPNCTSLRLQVCTNLTMACFKNSYFVI